ncbi:MAG TPA: 4Fe-4S dicluster domain-containing protein [Ignavibacteriaceae bacterium]|nr:4Fe-4S dicluster domain-containing protein [Ignavibacteriaceae bacterium]
MFFLLTTVVFLDIFQIIPAGITNSILFLQFVPSLINFLKLPALIAAGFIFITVITILAGRIYCSSVCPVGTLQDFIMVFRKKVKGRKKYGYRKENYWLRYTVFLLTLLFFISGNLIIVNILDPYSNFGRIVAQIFNPILSGLNNVLAFTLENLNIYILYPVEIRNVPNLFIFFPLIFLAVIIYLSFTRGRLYCNTICPVGTLLGLFSKFSLYKLRIDEVTCEGCDACRLVCKSECIDSENKEIKFDRCVNCFNCINVCPSKSVSYKNVLWNNPDGLQEIDNSKRDFISKTLLYLIGLTGFSYAQTQIIPKKENTKPVIRKFVSSPPGSSGIKQYNQTCTACHLCISACPTKVLQPSFLEYGFIGILQPFMDYKVNFCNYECTICGDVCPSGAIRSLTVEQKKITQVGKTTFIKENCIVETEGTSCGACSEHCPTKAVTMVDYKEKLKIPEVRNQYCIGCGACEFVCPTKPYKAIYVEGNEIHLIAEKNIEKKLEEKSNLKEDFPF